MDDQSERERGLFRDWAVRKPWAPGAKNADKTLAPADETDGAHDPVLEAFNALAATDPDGEAAAAEESQEASAEDAPAATAVAVAEPEAPTVEPDPPAAEEPSPPAEAAPPAPAAAAPPIPVASAAMPEGSWNPEPVRGPGRAEKAGEKLSHVNERGEARMVDVTEKEDTDREAVAEGYVTMQASTLKLVMGGALAKGDVLSTARIAGIMAAKRTSDLIPMCHPLAITGVTVDLAPSGEGRLRIEASVRTTGKTGVEMEALTAVTVAALTVYDMAKAVDRGMRIEGVRLLEKRGGKSGDWKA
jgi:cyclic pyranopterin monophosphate synthase